MIESHKNVQECRRYYFKTCFFENFRPFCMMMTISLKQDQHFYMVWYCAADIVQLLQCFKIEPYIAGCIGCVIRINLRNMITLKRMNISKIWDNFLKPIWIGIAMLLRLWSELDIRDIHIIVQHQTLFRLHEIHNQIPFLQAHTSMIKIMQDLWDTVYYDIKGFYYDIKITMMTSSKDKLNKTNENIENNNNQW